MSGQAPGADQAPSTDWTRYFDDLESSMHDFEVALSQHHVQPLRIVAAPPGHPPESLRARWGVLYERITELEFRTQMQREELRAEVARLPRGRDRTGRKAEWNNGSSLDING